MFDVMKRIIVLFLILFLTGCGKDLDNPVIDDLGKMDIEVNTYKDDNPIKVGLYEDTRLVKNYDFVARDNSEIGVFNIYYTDKDVLDSKNIKNNFRKYYNEYDDVSKYKIGFEISFMVDDVRKVATILEPTTEYFLAPYIYVYLYDDVNQENGAWYSHLTMDDMNDETVFSSIKLYYTAEGAKITSPIELTVFTYDDDDFDSNGNYIGNSKYTMWINILK